MPVVRFQFVVLRKRVYTTGKSIMTTTNAAAGRGKRMRRFFSRKPVRIMREAPRTARIPDTPEPVCTPACRANQNAGAFLYSELPRILEKLIDLLDLFLRHLLKIRGVAGRRDGLDDELSNAVPRLSHR